MKPKVVTGITYRGVSNTKGALPVWCVEYQQGTVSSYRYMLGKDEMDAYRIFMKEERAYERARKG